MQVSADASRYVERIVGEVDGWLSHHEGLYLCFLHWEPFVVTGGGIALDTYDWEGPRRLVDELIAPPSRFAIIGLVGRRIIPGEARRLVRRALRTLSGPC